MKLYVATAFQAKARVHNFMAKLRECVQDASLSCDWTALDETLGARRIALAEERGIVEADVVVVLLPGGFGTHSELGIAIGRGVPIVLVGELKDRVQDDGWPRCIQYAHPSVTRFDTEEEAIAYLAHSEKF